MILNVIPSNSVLAVIPSQDPPTVMSMNAPHPRPMVNDTENNDHQNDIQSENNGLEHEYPDIADFGDTRVSRQESDLITVSLPLHEPEMSRDISDQIKQAMKAIKIVKPVVKSEKENSTQTSMSSPTQSNESGNASNAYGSTTAPNTKPTGNHDVPNPVSPDSEIDQSQSDDDKSIIIKKTTSEISSLNDRTPT